MPIPENDFDKTSVTIYVYVVKEIHRWYFHLEGIPDELGVTAQRFPQCREQGYKTRKRAYKQAMRALLWGAAYKPQLTDLRGGSS